jgi:hypothetical protein
MGPAGRHREAALAAVAIHGSVSGLAFGLLRFARNDAGPAFMEER